MILFAVVALWLSTVTGYRSAGDVRAFILLTILVTSGVAAISYEGRRRAFWVGFFITALAAGIKSSANLELYWVPNLLNAYGLYQNFPTGFLNHKYVFFDATLRALVMLLLATVMGIIGILIYEQSQRTKD